MLRPGSDRSTGSSNLLAARSDHLDGVDFQLRRVRRGAGRRTAGRGTALNRSADLDLVSNMRRELAVVGVKTIALGARRGRRTCPRSAGRARARGRGIQDELRLA